MLTFRPGLLPTLTVLFALPVLVMLGTWQVQRLHWKTDLIATLDARADEAPVELPVNGNLDATLNHRRIAARGTLHPDPALRFGITRLDGAPAHHILQRATLSDGRDLVVDRGVVAADSSLPATPTGIRALEGYLRWIADAERQWPVPPNDPEANHWYWYDRAAFEDAFGVPLLPVVLVLTPVAGEPKPTAPVPQPLAVDLPNNHLGYALTWYGLAVSLVVIYGAYGYKRGKETL